MHRRRSALPESQNLGCVGSRENLWWCGLGWAGEKRWPACEALPRDCAGGSRASNAGAGHFVSWAICGMLPPRLCTTKTPRCGWISLPNVFAWRAVASSSRANAVALVACARMISASLRRTRIRSSSSLSCCRARRRIGSSGPTSSPASIASRMLCSAASDSLASTECWASASKRSVCGPSERAPRGRVAEPAGRLPKKRKIAA
jgi:hypothetical protein